MPPAQQAPMVPAVPDIYAPWRMHAPTAFVMGLQKSGTTLVGATLAAAMGTPYEPEAVGDCCKALDMEGCARKAEEYEQTYNFLPHGKFYSKDISKFFEKCSDGTLLKPPQEVPIRDAAGNAVAPAFANFARAQRLNFQLVYVTRHPLTVIRATQEWIADKQSHGKHKQWDTSVAEIAKMWRKAARL